MSEYARAAFRLLTPFRHHRNDKTVQTKQSYVEPNQPSRSSNQCAKDQKMSCQPNSYQSNSQIVRSGRPVFQIHENISSQEGEANISQLTMSQLSSTNDSFSFHPRSQRLPSCHSPANMQQVRKSNSQKTQASSDSSRYTTADTQLLHWHPTRTLDHMKNQNRTPHRNMKREEDTSLFDGLFFNDGSHPGTNMVVPCGLQNNQHLWNRPVSQQSTLTQTAKKRSWMEACLDTLRTPHHRKRLLDSSQTPQGISKTMSLSLNSDTGWATPSIATTKISSVNNETSMKQDDTSTDYRNEQGSFISDMTRQYTNFTQELQQTQQILCSQLQQKYDHLMDSLQKEFSQSSNVINQAQVKGEELSKSFHDSLKEAVNANEEKIHSLFEARLESEKRKWILNVSSEPEFLQVIDMKISETLSLHQEQMEQKLKLLEQSLSSLRDVTIHQRIYDIPPPITTASQVNSSMPAKMVSDTYIRTDSEPVKHPSPKLLSYDTTMLSLETPSKPCTKDVKKCSRKVAKNRDVHSVTTSSKTVEKATEKFITPLLSQDPIRKRRLEDIRTSVVEAVLSPKNVPRSAKVNHIPDSVLSTNLDYSTTPLYKRRRNKDKVYGKKTTLFDDDPYDFL